MLCLASHLKRNDGFHLIWISGFGVRWLLILKPYMPTSRHCVRYVTYMSSLKPFKGLPWWLSVKESACHAGVTGDTGSTPGSGQSPGGGHGNPLQYSCLENPMDGGAWQLQPIVSQRVGQD